MKKLMLAIAALAVASVYMAGCTPKAEKADNPNAAGGNGKPDSKEAATE